MPSLDFEKEKKKFRIFYDQHISLMNDAKNSFITLINALITHDSTISTPKVEGRVKDREEAVKKFSRKYRPQLEAKEVEYEIKEYITDLIGIRIVCLYEDDIDKLADLLEQHFEVIEVTDKISELESTEDSFGYKGLHLDMRLNRDRQKLPEYEPYYGFSFEIQIRTLIQDSWSVLDHQIKYKKSIPNHLKRRINVLAALFELADREFLEIRDSTLAEMQKAEDLASTDTVDDLKDKKRGDKAKTNELNAFNFMKIAGHFFNDYEFDPQKVDSFVHDIYEYSQGITRSQFHNFINKNIVKVKQYKQYVEETNPKKQFNQYAMIMHCLYLGDKSVFERALSNAARNSFEKWLVEIAL